MSTNESRHLLEEFADRRMDRRTVIKLIVGSAGALASSSVLGCAATTPTAAPTQAPTATTTVPKTAIKRGGTFRGAEGPTLILDGHTQTAGVFNTYQALYDSMTCLYNDPVTGESELQPELAQSWEQPTPDVMLFHLQEGVKFHDGSDWNAEAAKWNLERMATHAKSTSKPAVANIDKVEVVDPLTLRVTLKGPSAILPLMLSRAGSQGTAYMISMAAMEKLGKEGFEKQPSGTGPFILEERVPDDHNSFRRNPDYWRMGEDGKPLPYVDKAIFRKQLDLTIVANELRAGSLDMGTAHYPLLIQDLPAIEADPNLVVWKPPTAATFWVVDMNAQKGVLSDNLKLRQAVDYAIDREAVAKAFSLGKGRAAYSWWGVPGQLGYDPALHPTYDPEKAKQLIKEAGYPSGVDITIMPMTTAAHQQIAVILKQMLDGVGLRSTVTPLDVATWIQQTRSGDDWDLALRWSFYMPDPDGHTRNLVSYGMGNFSGWNNPEMDKCMDEGRTTLDTQKRSEVYAGCEQIRLGDLHNILVNEADSYFAFAKSVKGARLNWNLPDVRFVWLDR